ncbi:MAG TPA: hypothetical protein VF666_16940 [Pyrinomonadaceae bacterium]|jgi:hypothetical protein
MPEESSQPDRRDDNLDASAEGEPSLYNVTINTPEKMTGIPISVTRPKPEAAANRFVVGDRIAVGLSSFTVLPNYTLTTERASRTLDARG